MKREETGERPRTKKGSVGQETGQERRGEERNQLTELAGLDRDGQLVGGQPSPWAREV